MGGYGAVKLGLKHLEMFGSVNSHSGALGFLRVEAHSEILHTEDTVRINDRGEERVVNVAIRVLGGENTVAARHLPNSRRFPLA